MHRQTDRWELAAPFDALSWALCLKNRRAARALLEKRETLTWTEGSEYAPLTLGWAPELLDMILDRVPEGEEELFCVRTLPRPGDGEPVHVCAGLLTAAAAMDDLRAVEFLLDRGYETKSHELSRNIHLSPHFHELGRIRSNTEITFINWVKFPRMDYKGLHISDLDHASPLSAAIFCGAERCALRLLREAVGELDLSDRHALLRPELDGDTKYPSTVRAVTAALGTDLAELLDPGDFMDRTHPLFLECLKRHRDEISPVLAGCLLAGGNTKAWARDCLRVIDPMLLSRCFLDMLSHDPQTFRAYRVGFQDLKYVFDEPGLDLVLDRNAIPQDLNNDVLLAYLDHARVVGDVPEGKLSSLAVRLLNDIMERSSKSGIADGRPIPVSAKYRSILREEDPKLIWRYLNEKGRGKDPAVLVVLSLLRGGRA